MNGEIGDASYSSEKLPVGLVLSDRYEICKILGVGGMATVYLAQDRYKDDCPVAVKVLKREFTKDKVYIERFLNEISILSKIQHPNVIRFYDADMDKETGLVYYSMERIEGESLHDLIERKQLSSSEISKIVLSICDGLSAIHKRGILHRDLKPENILIDGDGVVKITDFGVARDTASSRRLTTKLQKVGSMNYMAPERWFGENVGEPSDLYALGVMLYQMVFYDLPFIGDTVKDIMEAHLEDKLSFPEGAVTANWIKGLLTQLLEKNPKNRLQSSQDVIQYVLNNASDDLSSKEMAVGDVASAGYDPIKHNTKSYTLMFRATRNISSAELGWDKPVPKASVVIKLPRNRTVTIEIEKPSLDFLFLGIFLISLLTMDGILTALGISEAEIHLEANPFVAYMMEIFGKNSALIITKAISIIFVVFITRLAKHQKWIKNMIAVLSCVYLCAAIIPWVFVLHYYN